MRAWRRSGKKQEIGVRNVGVKERRRYEDRHMGWRSVKAREQRADRAIRMIVDFQFVERGTAIVSRLARRRPGPLNAAAWRRSVPPAVDAAADDMHQRMQPSAQSAHQAHEGEECERGRSGCRGSRHVKKAFYCSCIPHLRRRGEELVVLVGCSSTGEAGGLYKYGNSTCRQQRSTWFRNCVSRNARRRR